MTVPGGAVRGGVTARGEVARRLAAEFCGTALLLLAVVGSGVSASAGGAASAQLFQHALVVGISLGALVAAFAPVSGAHLNPAVTLGLALLGDIRPRLAAGYAAVQVAGGLVGTVLANILFSLPAVALATTDRTGAALAVSEGVATFGLLLVIAGVARGGRPGGVPVAVGAYIAGAIYFTSSASFANPAVTLARVATDTYTGIGPPAVPGFLVAQLAGALAAALAARGLFAPAGGPRAVDAAQADPSRKEPA